MTRGASVTLLLVYVCSPSAGQQGVILVHNQLQMMSLVHNQLHDTSITQLHDTGRSCLPPL